MLPRLAWEEWNNARLSDIVGPTPELAVKILESALLRVNQAAWALGRLGDPEAIPALIDAIVTKHKFPVYPGGAPGSINAGSGGLQMGGRPKIMECEFQNRQVLAALTALTPDGINFGYSEQAWKDWWARQQTPAGVNLRRDL